MKPQAGRVPGPVFRIRVAGGILADLVGRRLVADDDDW